MKQKIKALKDQLIELNMYSVDKSIPAEVLAKILIKSKELREITLKMYEVQQQYDQGLLLHDHYQTMIQALYKLNDAIIQDYLKTNLSEPIPIDEKTIKELEEISKMSLGDEE